MDVCGKRCDRWIAVEGQIDSNAAARFRKFLSQQRDRRLPIYFYSRQPQFEFNEQSVAADGRRMHQTVALCNEGRAVALDRLLVTCPPSKTPTPSQAAISSDHAEE